jgi:hypothetical protein
MCAAFFMILAWHQHGDLTSLKGSMIEIRNVVSKVSSRDPRLDILDFQLFAMGENATRSQLRSLTMSKATEELDGNPPSISAKDLLPVSKIMQEIDEALSGSNDLPIAEGLWEIALKLRIQASEAVEAVAVGCLPKMAAILSAQPHGGWSRVEKCSDSSTLAKLKMQSSTVGDRTIYLNHCDSCYGWYLSILWYLSMHLHLYHMYFDSRDLVSCKQVVLRLPRTK